MYPLIFAACQAKEGFNWHAYLPLEFCMNKKAARDEFKIIPTSYRSSLMKVAEVVNKKFECIGPG